VNNLIAIERYTSVTAQWNEPLEPNGLLIRYEIMFNDTKTGLPKAVNISVTEFQFPITNLTTGQSVVLSVRAYTRIGPGVFSVLRAVTRERPG